jgi:hypothetical protein
MVKQTIMKATVNTANRTFGMLIGTVKTILVALFIFGSTNESFSQQCEFQAGNVGNNDATEEVCFYKYNVDHFELMGCLQCQITGGAIKCGNGVIAAAGYSNYDMISYSGSQCFNAAVLPVELKEFNYNKNFFTWITASELNNDYFTIEQSYDMENWFEIAQIESTVNTSNTDTRYQYEYENMDQATVYYRLTQVDFDGTKKSFEAISVKSENESKIEAYPNPSNTGVFTISNTANVVELTVSNMNGQVVASTNTGQAKLDLSAEQNGVYIMTITQVDGSVNFERLVVSK